MNTPYRLPTYLGVLAAIDMIFITATALLSPVSMHSGGLLITVTGTTPFILAGGSYALIALLLGIHRVVGGRTGAILSAYGLINIPLLQIWLNFVIYSIPRTPEVGYAFIALFALGPLVPIVAYVSRFQNEFVPRAPSARPSDDSPLPLTLDSYIQRAAQRLEQAAPNTNTLIDEQNIFIYRNERLWGVAWAFHDGAALHPDSVRELAAYRRELGIAGAALIAPSFSEEVRIAASGSKVKLVSA